LRARPGLRSLKRCSVSFVARFAYRLSFVALRPQLRAHLLNINSYSFRAAKPSAVRCRARRFAPERQERDRNPPRPPTLCVRRVQAIEERWRNAKTAPP
jgi:hypothetical protein